MITSIFNKSYLLAAKMGKCVTVIQYVTVLSLLLIKLVECQTIPDGVFIQDQAAIQNKNNSASLSKSGGGGPFMKPVTLLLTIFGGVVFVCLIVIVVFACYSGVFKQDKDRKNYFNVGPNSESISPNSTAYRDNRVSEGRVPSFYPTGTLTQNSRISFSIADEDENGYLLETPSPSARSRDSNIYEFSRDTLYFKDVLGEGEFGYVLKAKFRPKNLGSQYLDCRSQTVAVKCPKQLDNNSNVFKDFVQEAELIKDFNHPNVLSVIGVCPNDEIDCEGGNPTFNQKIQGKLQSILPHLQRAPWAIIPYYQKGDLKKFLYNIRVKRKTTELPYHTLLSYAVDICKGMAYLASKKIVHRDLAARNCLLADDGRVIVSDFGLSRPVYYNQNYYRLKTRKPLPIKWMAIEGIEDHVFSEKSDVWSFGVTFWEILEFSVIPYPGVEASELATYLRSGSRLRKPTIATNDVWKLIMSCWKDHPNDRPKFASLLKDLTKIVKKYQKLSPHLAEKEMVPEPPPRTKSLESFLFPPPHYRHGGQFQQYRKSEMYFPTFVGSRNELSPVFSHVC